MDPKNSVIKQLQYQSILHYINKNFVIGIKIHLQSLSKLNNDIMLHASHFESNKKNILITFRGQLKKYQDYFSIYFQSQGLIHNSSLDCPKSLNFVIDRSMFSMKEMT